MAMRACHKRATGVGLCAKVKLKSEIPDQYRFDSKVVCISGQVVINKKEVMEIIFMRIQMMKMIDDLTGKEEKIISALERGAMIEGGSHTKNIVKRLILR